MIGAPVWIHGPPLLTLHSVQLGLSVARAFIGTG